MNDRDLPCNDRDIVPAVDELEMQMCGPVYRASTVPVTVGKFEEIGVVSWDAIPADDRVLLMACEIPRVVIVGPGVRRYASQPSLAFEGTEKGCLACLPGMSGGAQVKRV